VVCNDADAIGSRRLVVLPFLLVVVEIVRFHLILMLLMAIGAADWIVDASAAS
jgi:hypothetical protein